MAREIAFCVLTTHDVSGADCTPRRFISEAQLQHFQAVERAHAELCAALGQAMHLVPFVGPAPDAAAIPAILPACSLKSKSFAIAAPGDPIVKSDPMPASTAALASTSPADSAS